jgi:hypothetical protein
VASGVPHDCNARCTLHLIREVVTDCSFTVCSMVGTKRIETKKYVCEHERMRRFSGLRPRSTYCM